MSGGEGDEGKPCLHVPRAEVVIASDDGKPLARELVQAKEKRVATLGRISVPAGASVIRFAVKKSAPGFKPLGLKFE